MLGKSSRGWVGIDVGESAIKIAQLLRSGDRLSVGSVAVYPRAGVSLKEDLVGAKTLAENTQGASAAAALSMAQSLVESDEAAVHDPDRCSDTWSVGEDDRYLLSVPTRRIDETLEGLTATGLACEAIDGAPQAIARAVQLTPGWRPDELLGVLDWGESAVTLVASEGGVAKYVRRLRCEGFSSMRKEVAASLGLSEPDADTAMRRWGVAAEAGTPGRRVGEAVRATLQGVTREATRTLEHLGGKLKSPGPNRLVVLGAGATVPGLPKLLGESLGLPSEAWRASGLESREGSDIPDCLLAQAIALSALAWEAAS